MHLHFLIGTSCYENWDEERIAPVLKIHIELRYCLNSRVKQDADKLFK